MPLMGADSALEDVTIPGGIVKVEGVPASGCFKPDTGDTSVNGLIFYRKAQKITPNLLALLAQDKCVNEIISCKKPQKTISNLLKMN